MQNGYALPTEVGLAEISGRLNSMTDSEHDELRQALRIGIHWDTQVLIFRWLASGAQNQGCRSW